MHVLAGDVGGTKTLLQLARADGANWRTVAEQRFDSHGYDGLVPIIEAFLRTDAVPRALSVEAACFGIAGPVTETERGQYAKVTNLPWEVASDVVAHAFGVTKVRLINDFQAVGYGIEGLSDADFVTLNAASARARAPRAVVGAGTGLGQAILVWVSDHYEAIATEGGHVDFAPTDALQFDLLQYLKERFGRVSYERLVSGPGIVNIYRFLCARAGAESPALAAAMRQGDPAAAITEAGLAGSDALAGQALDLFVTIYGAQAGNLALTCLAQGGVYVAGGIAPKIIGKLLDGTFKRAFVDKGRMAPLLRAMPVQVVMNPKVGLLGAALVAGRL